MPLFFAGLYFVVPYLTVYANTESSSAAHLDVYAPIAQALFGSTTYTPVIASCCILFLIWCTGICFKRNVVRQLHSGLLTPSPSLSLGSLVELVLGFIKELAFSQFGSHWAKFAPLLGALFFFILTSNLSGLVPGLPPPTASFSVNLAMGLVVFFSYNIAGVKEHGLAYVKQFTGPFLLLAPLFVVLEVVSHCARPLSLAFRLTANIFCDHLVLGVFSSLVPFVVPSVLMLFGLLVAAIQSFVFTILSAIYIQMAVSHEH